MRSIVPILLFLCFHLALGQAAEGSQSIVTEIDNPAAAGGRYPFATAGAGSGTLMMSWFEPDLASPGPEGMKLMWAAFDGQGWSLPETVQSQKGEGFFVNWADFPSIVAVGETPIAAHWPQAVPGSSYAYHVNLAFRTDEGGWSEPITPHADQSATEHGFVSLVPIDQGRVFAIWLDGYQTKVAGHGAASHAASAGTPDLSTAMTLRSAMIHRDGSRGEELEVDSAVCDCCQTSAARSGNRIIVVYRDRSAAEVRDTYRAIYDLEEGAWSEPLALSHEGWEIAGCPVNGPQVAAHGDTVIATWFTAVDDAPRSYLAVSRDGGLGFEETQLLDHGASMGRTATTFNSEGTALLTWIGPAEAPTLVYGRLWRASGLSERFVIGEIEASRASGFPRTAAAGADFLVAWTVPDAESRIKTVLVSP